MKTRLLIICLLPFFSFSQDKKLKVQDLDFLIGEWEVTLDFFRTHQPNEPAYFYEKGNMNCKYDMELNGVPMFIKCTSYLEVYRGKYKGRKRVTVEYIRYGNFSKGFERIGVFSNWPATAIETLKYVKSEHKFVIKGELVVPQGLERYQDTYTYNADYSEFKRRNIANFSDMPIAEFNLTYKGTGRKIKQ